MTKKEITVVALKSYVIALLVAAIPSVIDSIIDFTQQTDTLQLIDIQNTFVLSVPIFFFVFYAMRHKDKKVRKHKAILAIIYLILTIVGAVLGLYVTFLILGLIDATSTELDMGVLMFLPLGLVIGALLLPLSFFLAKKHIRR